MFEFIRAQEKPAFGQNVKRRVVLGNYLMQRYAQKGEASNLINAQKFRRMIIEQFS
jgi:hypothetical protein